MLTYRLSHRITTESQASDARSGKKMAKRNWDVVVVVPGRENNDGTATPAAYFAGKRVNAANGSRKLESMREIAPVALSARARKATA